MANVSLLRESSLTLPSRFVKEHGNKFEQSVILRTKLSTKSWDVTVSIEYPKSLTSARVSLSGGWRAFADFNSLSDGDSLIFCLTAMSEFEVYIFRHGNRKFPKVRPASPVLRDTFSNGFKLSRETLSEQSTDYNLKDEQPTVEGINGSTVNFNGNLFATKLATGEVSSVCGGGRCSKFCNMFLEFPRFSKKLTATNIYHRGACLEIPLDFCKAYGSRLCSDLVLQGIHEESQKRTMACRATRRNPVRHFLRAEWRDFVDENNLEVGQVLLFALTADSFFVVRQVHTKRIMGHGPRFNKFSDCRAWTSLQGKCDRFWISNIALSLCTLDRLEVIKYFSYAKRTPELPSMNKEALAMNLQL